MARMLDPVMGDDPRLNCGDLLSIPRSLDCGDGRWLWITKWTPEVELSPNQPVRVTIEAMICSVLPEAPSPPPLQEPPDIDMTTMDTPAGFRAYMRRDGTTYLTEVEG